MKHAIRHSAFTTLDVALDRERDLMRALGKTADYREGVAAFLENRGAVFHGR
jgi:2-(1,2-epoxy-1,2-dihydrophenyl)acetyl-CoA isomerase